MDCSEVRDDLLDVLYGEASAEGIRRVEEHKASCAPCRAELAELASTRKSLEAWRLPPTARARVAGPWAWSWRGLAAAAVLLVAMGAGLGLTGSEFRYEGGRVSLRLGHADQAELRAALAEQEQRHAQEIAALKAVLPVADSRGEGRDGERVLSRVRDMIRESEGREAVLLTSSLQDLSEENARQRRYDLARISAGLSYLDERNVKHVAQTTELMGYVLQAAQKK